VFNDGVPFQKSGLMITLTMLPEQRLRPFSSNESPLLRLVWKTLAQILQSGETASHLKNVGVGILNLANKMKAITILLLLTPLQALSNRQIKEECTKVKSAQIVRIDEGSGGRVFVQINPSQISTQRKAKLLLLSLQEKIAECYPHFGKEWNASFFSDKRYANYKSDIVDNKSPLISDWSDHYLGEYNRKERKLTLYPLLPKKLKHLSIVLP
jgi:hypothetical protein